MIWWEDREESQLYDVPQACAFSHLRPAQAASSPTPFHDSLFLWLHDFLEETFPR